MYADHRARLFELLSNDRTAAVIPTASAKTRNHDCEYRFRPDSDFWYVTGFAEPEACLVLLPRIGEPSDEDAGPRSILYLRERDEEKEIWYGRRLGVDAAVEAIGVDEARPIGKLWDDLPELLSGYERIVYHLGADQDDDRRMIETLVALRAKARAGVRPPVELIDHAPYLHEARLFKGEGELEQMREAARITTESHAAAMREAAPGVNECEIDALLDYTFRRMGSSGPAYTSIVAGGANACVLHYIENDAPLADGELCLIDAGAEYQGYACDVTRTFPVNGTFTEPQRALYELVLAAQEAAVDHIEPGATVVSVHETARDVLIEGLIELGLCEGTLESVVEDESYKAFFMHRTGHWIGLDVHDCGYYAVEGSPRVLEPGMALTVEPGLYVDPANEDVDECWRGIGVRIEDSVLVTAEGHEILTAAIPKQVDEVEAACAGSGLAATRA